MAGLEAGAPPPVSEPPSIQREPPQEDGSLLPSSCALPPTPKSSPCLSTTMQLMQALSQHLTMTNIMLGAMHLTPSLPVGASQTGESGLLHLTKFHMQFWLLAGVIRIEIELYLFDQMLILHVLSNKHGLGATARCSEHAGSMKRQSALHCLHTIIYFAFWAARIILGFSLNWRRSLLFSLCCPCIDAGLQWLVTGMALALLLVAPLSSGRASLPRQWMRILLQSIINRVSQWVGTVLAARYAASLPCMLQQAPALLR